MMYSWIVLLLTLLSLSGCSTFKGFFGSEKNEDYNALTYGAEETAPAFRSAWANLPPSGGSLAHEPEAAPTRNTASASSENPDASDKNALDPTDEKVRDEIEVNRGLAVAAYNKGDRATRSDFYDATPNDGSLWSNQNDSNYFFTKGKVHAMGDIVSVKMEPTMVRSLAEEVKKSLSPAEQQVEMALYTKNSDATKDDKDLKAYRNIASEDLKTNEAEVVKNRMEKAVRWSQVDLSSVIGVAPNDELRAEVIDRYPNGNYKIRAVKRMLYRGSSKMVSLVAIAPESDFDEKDMITSGKLYDYKIKVAR